MFRELLMIKMITKNYKTVYYFLEILKLSVLFCYALCIAVFPEEKDMLIDNTMPTLNLCATF